MLCSPHIFVHHHILLTMMTNDYHHSNRSVRNTSFLQSHANILHGRKIQISKQNCCEFFEQITTNTYLCTGCYSATCKIQNNVVKGGHNRNVTAHCNTVSWQCGRDSWPRNVSKVG